MEKVLLSIAGYDPTSGAGTLLDLKVFQHRHFLGMGILTSITAQNTKRVKKIHCLPPELIWNQYETLHKDIHFSGIKVGMVGCKNNLQIIDRILSENLDIPTVVDPVFKSSSGFWLIEKEAVSDYINTISGKASLLTPNLEEASLISGINIKNPEHMKKAAQRIFAMSGIPCIIKGGHLPESPIDLLYNGSNFYPFERERIEKNVHGTGCLFSSAVLCCLANKIPLKKSCYLAGSLTYDAIKSSIPVGKGQNIITF